MVPKLGIIAWDLILIALAIRCYYLSLTKEETFHMP